MKGTGDEDCHPERATHVVSLATEPNLLYSRRTATHYAYGGLSMQLCRRLGLTLVCVTTMTADVDAQETASDTLLTVDHFLDWERVGDPQLSPNGSQIVFARRHVNQIEDRWDSELWIMNADGSRKRFLTKGSSPRWSLDGTRIAYLAQGEPSGTQVFVRWMDDEGATSQITRVIKTPAKEAATKTALEMTLLGDSL